MLLVECLRVATSGLAETGFQGFCRWTSKTILKLISMMLLHPYLIYCRTQASGTATGPAAIFTTPAFIATAVSGVIAALLVYPKFETVVSWVALLSTVIKS
jgi:hypothetical protein